MKPVIKKQKHFTVLLMREHKEVSNIRVRVSVLRFCISFFLLTLLAGAAGIFVGVHYWKKSTTFSANYPLLERELVETKLKLEQLTNESALWRNAKNAVPTPKNEEVGATATALQTDTSSSPPPPGSNILAPLQTYSVSSANATNPAPMQITPSVTASASATTTAKNAPVRLSNFSAKPAGPQRIRLRYTFTAEQQQSGTVKYNAKLNNGTTVMLQPSYNRFTASDTKTADVQIKLSQGVSAQDITEIEVTLELKNGQKIQETFPVK